MTPYLYVFNVVFFFYILICTVVGFFFGIHEKLFPEELYWPLVFAGLLGALAFKERANFSKFSFAEFAKKNRDVFFVFTTALILRIYLIDQVELWVDEDYQAYSSLIHRGLIAGVWQHQPPLDMILTKFGILLGNESLVGLRIHSVLCSSFASALLYDQVKKFSRSTLMAVALTVFFALHFISIRFGYEARPISLGFLYCIGFLAIITSLLEEKQNSFYYKTPLFNCLIIFAFLNSLGMQPVILTGAAFGFLTLYYFNKNSWFKKPFIALLSGFVLFIPIQLYILKYAPPRFTKQVGFSLSAYMNELGRLENFLILKPYFWPFGCLFLLSCIIYFALNLKKNRSIQASIVFLLTLIILFPLFLVPFFKSHIAWDMNKHYFALLLPTVLIGTAFLIRIFLDYLPQKGYVKNTTIILFFGSATFLYPWGPLTNLSAVYKQTALKGAYEFLNENSTDRDLDLVLCLNTTAWCPDNFVLQSFYYKKAVGGLSKSWVPVFENFTKALKNPVAPENIYFIYYANWSNKQLEGDIPYRVQRLHHIDLFKVPVQQNNLAQTMIDFCKPYVEQGLAENVLYVVPVEYIVASAEALGQKDLRNYYLRLYKDFAGKKVDSRYLNKLLQEP